MGECVIGPGARARVDADDGFFFGMGAFETIAVSGGAPVLLDDHLTRLGETLRYLGIEARRADLEMMVLRACAGLGASDDSALKLTVTERNRVVSLRRNPYAAPGAKRVFRCDFADVRRNESSPLARMKTLAYAENIMEKRRARDRAVDEPLFLNTRGEVAEGAVSNVFAVIGGDVVTPPVSCGLLPGVMRHAVIGFTGAVERPITPDELLRADEVFLTNSLMGAMPVAGIGGVEFEPGSVSRDVNDAYARMVARTRARAQTKEFR